MKLPCSTLEKREYARHWSNNAEHFKSQDCYSWMAAKLAPLAPKKILDVGCGTGQGIAALMEQFCPQIVSLEENADCIKAAAERLRTQKYSVNAILRVGYEEHSDGSHYMHFDQTLIDSKSPITLLHADVLMNDPEMLRFINNSGPFDAVTIWLIGTYMMRANCRNLASLNIQSASDYRLHVQNRIYELAHQVLRPGGYLHVVDRGLPLDTHERFNQVLLAHREQAEPTDLEVFDVTWRDYAEPTNWGVKMVANPDSNGQFPDTSSLAMISVLSRKPK